MFIDTEILRRVNPIQWNAFIQCTKYFSEGETDEALLLFKPEVQFPLPYMIYITLVMLLNFKDQGREEKVAWTISYKYKNFSFAVSHRKFGLRFFSSSNVTEEIKKEMIVRLRRATEVADKVVEPIIREKFLEGNFALQNNSGSFFNRYIFFRDKAKEAFNAPPPPSTPIYDDEGKVIGASSSPFQPIREGFYYTQAMLDAFFSFIEHLMILLLPFQDFDVTKEKVVYYMSADWTTKYNRVFAPEKNPIFMRHYRNLDEIKERYRNTFAHGGFEKKGASLYVQFPHFGYIPISLSRYRDSVNYSMFPLEERDYEKICKVLDEFLNDINAETFRRKMEIINSGLDIYFDSKTIEEYKSALTSDGNLYSFIEYESYVYNRNVNMDW